MVAVATGSYGQALKLTRAIVPAAHTLGYLPFKAEAEFQLGFIEHLLGDTAHAETSLLAAVWSAEAGRNNVIAARAWTTLVYLVGVRKGRVRSRTHTGTARDRSDRLGGSSNLESSLEQALSAIAFELHEFDAAVAHLENAVMLEERVFSSE